MAKKKINSLDEARKAYFDKEISHQEYFFYLKKFAMADNRRKELEKSMKELTKKLAKA